MILSNTFRFAEAKEMLQNFTKPLPTIVRAFNLEELNTLRERTEPLAFLSQANKGAPSLNGFCRVSSARGFQNLQALIKDLELGVSRSAGDQV